MFIKCSIYYSTVLPYIIVKHVNCIGQAVADYDSFRRVLRNAEMHSLRMRARHYRAMRRECKSLVEMAKRNEFPPDWDLNVPIDEVRLPAAKLLEIAHADNSGLREFEVRVLTVENIRIVSAALCYMHT